MNNLDSQYKELCEYILKFGNSKTDRTGTGTKSIFGWTITHNMNNGFPVLTTKKIAWNNVVSELLWFLSGDTNIKSLIDKKNYIWVGDAYKKYVKYMYYSNHHKINESSKFTCLTKDEFINKIKDDNLFAAKWGDLGPIYGKQWRMWKTSKVNIGSTELTNIYIDQINNLIDELRNNPDSRRLMVSAWNVGELDDMTLPPCHYGFQCYTRELTTSEREKLNVLYNDKPDNNEIYNQMLDQHNIPKRALSLKWNQRSVDVGLGLPFNIASYGLLLTILSKMVNMIPDMLIGSFGDTHIYNDHINGITEQITRKKFDLPSLVINSTDYDINFNGTIDDMLETCNSKSFILSNYNYHQRINLPLSN